NDAEHRDVEIPKGIAAFQDLVVLEDHRRAQVVDREHLTEQLGPLRPCVTASKQCRRVVGELCATCQNGAMQRVRKLYGEEKMADRRGRHDAERDLRDTIYRDEERVPGVECARYSDDCDRVAGQDKTISGEIPRVL